MDTSLVVTIFQTAGTLLTAVLLRILARGVPGDFLLYWSRGWAALAASLIGLNAWHLARMHAAAYPVGWVERPALAGFAVLEYTFGFFLWAGARGIFQGVRFTRSDVVLLVGPAAFGLAAPFVTRDPAAFFPLHAALFGGFCLLALSATFRHRPDGMQATVGLRLVQGGLLGLMILFWQFAVVYGWRLATDPDARLYTLHFATLYDAFILTLLAFGMVVLITDRVRSELEVKNRQLADATEQLAVAARTDPLTGLLNRRAFDAMLADRAGTPFAGSVAALDLNFLKTINDRHGHKAGDAAIQLTARALRAHFRITDPLFRMGGDEFLAVLEGGRSAELSHRLEAVAASLKGQRLPDVPGTVALEVAWGMADFDGAAALPDAMARADLAMYACKQRQKQAALV